MTSEFKIDNARIEKISKEFQIEKDIVDILYKAYLVFSPNLQGQFLAHVMRGIEYYIRNRMKNNRFIVICEPYKKGEFHPGQKQAVSYYYPPKATIRSSDKKSSSFIINYNGDLPEKELRDYIAHEVGHIFLVAMAKDNAGSWNSNKIPDTEPLSSIFGIFTMSEKNDFYANYDTSVRNHTNWQELFDFFLDIHKKKGV
jgi:hypothetical protein